MTLDFSVMTFPRGVRGVVTFIRNPSSSSSEWVLCLSSRFSLILILSSHLHIYLTFHLAAMLINKKMTFLVVTKVSRWDLRCSGMLHSVTLQLVTDVSGQPVGTIFKCEAVWPLKIGPIGWPETSVTNCKSTMHNISEERRFRSRCGGSLKSRIV